MKFNWRDVPQKKRDEWERVWLKPQPKEFRIAYYKRKSMIWFVGDNICVDGMVFAACYGIPRDKTKVIEEIHRKLGKVHIIFAE